MADADQLVEVRTFAQGDGTAVVQMKGASGQTTKFAMTAADLSELAKTLAADAETIKSMGRRH